MAFNPTRCFSTPPTKLGTNDTAGLPMTDGRWGLLGTCVCTAGDWPAGRGPTSTPRFSSTALSSTALTDCSLGPTPQSQGALWGECSHERPGRLPTARPVQAELRIIPTARQCGHTQVGTVVKSRMRSTIANAIKSNKFVL
eukprot:364734-Chlamydomonas_euryale.AAC.7